MHRILIIHMERLRGDKMSGLFSTFNIAKRGLFTQQKAIGVTSHNISNANTEGYSRQRATIETTRPFGMPSMNSSIGPGQIGTGSTIQAIKRVRDEFLDYQIRTETSTMGKYDARDKFLSEIENIFNEPSDTGMSTLIGKFFDSWHQLSKQPQSSNARTIVAQQASALAKDLNHTYGQMQKLKGNVQMEIKQTVFETNNILNQIDQLNQQIMGVKVAGQEPNDLMDKRDLLLDKLSKIANMNIDKRDFNSIDLKPVDTNGVPGGGEKLLVRKEPNYAVSRFSYINSIKPTDDTYKEITISYFKGANSNEPGKDITINLADDPTLTLDQRKEIFRQIDETRVLWSDEDGTAYAEENSPITIDSVSELNEKLGLYVPSGGELNGYMTVQEDVDKYVDQMNNLAKAIALSVNAVHSGLKDPKSGTPPLADKDYMPFFVNKQEAQYDTNHVLNNLDNVLDKENEITAGNISINEQILHDVMQIKTRTNDDKFAYEKDNNIDGETDGNRALAIAQLRNKLIKIQDVNNTINSRADLFDPNKGGNTLNGLEFESNTNGMTVDGYFKDVIDELGIQTQEAKRIVLNQDSLLGGFQESKESISGVSLDEEMANMIQFQHAYQANAKIVSTVDELLDVVINGLKR